MISALLLATCVTTQLNIEAYHFCLGPTPSNLVCVSQPGNTYQFSRTENKTYIVCKLERGGMLSDPSEIKGPYQLAPGAPTLLITTPGVGE